MERNRFGKYMPRFDDNAVVKLIIYLGVTFIMARFTILLFIVYGNKGKAAEGIINGFLGLPPVYAFAGKWWTLFTHAWVHTGFWHWLSNMVWLFMFGSSFQLLAGKKHVLPTFVSSYLSAGIVYLLVQWLPFSSMHIAPDILVGAQAGIVGMAAALLTLSPNMKYYFSDYFGIRLWIIAIAFFLLMSLSVGFNPVGMAWLLGGIPGGMLYAWLFKKGYDPTTWYSGFSQKIQAPFSPKTPSGNSIDSAAERQQRIDQLLEKINQSGYASLSKSERALLEEESRKM